TEYESRAMPIPLPAGSHGDLEALTTFLFTNGLQGFFVSQLVNWRPFRRNPNQGHISTADLLTCGGAHSAVTTNFDSLIELGAMELGEDDFQPALDLPSANEPHLHHPLLKIHGSVEDKHHTLWCPKQLAPPPAAVTPPDQVIQQRLASCTTWLNANIVGKDIVFVGFWSDWAYLAPVLASALTGIRASLVVLVDPGAEAFLIAKAPELWKWAKTATEFQHVREPGEVFLSE